MEHKGTYVFSSEKPCISMLYSFFLSNFGHGSTMIMGLFKKGGEGPMEMKQLKKMLAGMSIASLLAGSSLMVSGCASNGSA
jgi:radical SAM modification target selenobiotic family peptide